MAFTAFVTDVYSRRIVGWRTMSSMPTALLRYSERLVDVGAIASTETVVGLYKTECVKIEGPFRTADELEPALHACPDSAAVRNYSARWDTSPSFGLSVRTCGCV